MQEKTIEEAFREYLKTLPLSTLRVLGRNLGAPSQKAGGKSGLIDVITAILTGKEQPVPRSNRGAPVKNNYIDDPAIMQKIADIRHSYEMPKEKFMFEVASPEPIENFFTQTIYTGILEIMQSGYGFLRAENCQPTSNKDVFIPAPLIHSLKLREGDWVSCSVKPRVKNDSAAIAELYSVNGKFVGEYENRPLFDSLTACYPNQQICLSQNEAHLSLRLLDLFIPIGKGQRALITAPPKAGKTTLLKNIAGAIEEQHRDINLIVLLIDERPEEVTDFRMSVKSAKVISSTFDEEAEHHIRAASLTIEHAKRLAEQGNDVVILLDSLTKLTRAYNYVAESSGKTLSGGLDVGALADPKRFFGTARNTLEAGSITILATALVETGSRMDDVIYEEFKGTGNADIFLSRDLAERRIYPAIDIRRSGTRKEELLLNKATLDAVYKLRERGVVENVEGVIDMLKKTENNTEFISRLGEWLKVYKA